MGKKIIHKIKEIISERLDVDIQYQQIADDALLLEDGLGLDSIAIVELIALVEEVFDIQFDEQDLNMDNFYSIQTLSQLIADKGK